MAAQRDTLILGTAGHIDHAASRAMRGAQRGAAERSRTG
jgi:hypothetical protein